MFFAVDLAAIEGAAILVVGLAAGVGDEVEGLAVEVGGEGVIFHGGMDGGGALEAVDDFGEFVEQASAGDERLVEAAGADEVDHGVGQLIEAVVVHLPQRGGRGGGATDGGLGLVFEEVRAAPPAP